MAWKCKKEIVGEKGEKLFIVDNIYEEQDDRGDVGSVGNIAICLMNEKKVKIYLSNKGVRNFFIEI